MGAWGSPVRTELKLRAVTPSTPPNSAQLAVEGERGFQRRCRRDVVSVERQARGPGAAPGEAERLCFSVDGPELLGLLWARKEGRMCVGQNVCRL